MATIKGITIEIDGNTTGLSKALQGVNREISSANSELRQVKSLLKLDPSNTELVAQKQAILSKAIADTSSKLSQLKQAKQEADKQLEKGEISEEQFRALTREIVKTENSLNAYEKELADSHKTEKQLKKETEELKKAQEKASKSTSVFGDVLKANLTSEALVAGIKGIASSIGKITSSVVDLGKQAVMSFAEYEQLIGGVETLFKESSDVVSQYANNAYKTAGLSANQYMETVTSFSASLLQSLDGDTASAAKYADQAITDMSDNANKMGTDISSIQTAYQGFAKQNYTMLDNLKLGYGGTKGEMERLLADAEKLSGTKYDISNLSDVYQAINVVQTELGITGTTAIEASTTISGSLSSMKSSWSNLLTGIANDQADMKKLISNFVKSIMTFADNVVPVIETALDGIVELVLGLADTLLPQVLKMGVKLLESLITGLVSNIGSIMAGINRVINTLISAIITLLPQIIQAGITIIISLVTGIAQSLPTLIPQIIEAILLIVNTLIENIDLLIDAGIQLIFGLAEGLLEALPYLIEQIPVIIDKLIIAITDNLPLIIEMGIKLVVMLAIGLIKAIPDLLKAIPKIFMSLINGIVNYYSNMFEKGKELLGKIKDGLIEGIKKIPEVGKKSCRRTMEWYKRYGSLDQKENKRLYRWHCRWN